MSQTDQDQQSRGETPLEGQALLVDRLLATRGADQAMEQAGELLLALSGASGVVVYASDGEGTLQTSWAGGQLDDDDEARLELARKAFHDQKRVNDETGLAIPLAVGAVRAVLVAEGEDHLTDDQVDLVTTLGSRALEMANLRASLSSARRERRALARMVSPALARSLGRADFEDSSLPTGRTITLLTLVAEGLADEFDIVGPGRLLAVAHEFYKILVDSCYEHDGLIVTHGLSRLACAFGVPLEGDDLSAADLAVAAAAVILERLGEMVERWGVQGLPVHLSARIGVATGQGVAGTFGPADRPVFSVLGPLVALSAKLAYQGEPGEVIVDSTTRTLLSDRIATRSIGAVEVQGLDYPIFSYSVQKILAP